MNIRTACITLVGIVLMGCGNPFTVEHGKTIATQPVIVTYFAFEDNAVNRAAGITARIEGDIDGIEDTITVDVYEDVDTSALSPTVKLSNGSVTTYKPMDFTSLVVFTYGSQVMYKTTVVNSIKKWHDSSAH